MKTLIESTRGNQYISLDLAKKYNTWYDYTVSFTAFTSILKFCKLLRLPP